MVLRGYWVHGVNNLHDDLRAAEQFTIDGRADAMVCPTFLTSVKDKRLAGGTQIFFDWLRYPKPLIRFTSPEGACDHGETGNRSLLNRRVLD